MAQRDLFDKHDDNDNDDNDDGLFTHDSGDYDPTWEDIAAVWGGDYLYHHIGRIPSDRRPPPKPPDDERS